LINNVIFFHQISPPFQPPAKQKPPLTIQFQMSVSLKNTPYYGSWVAWEWRFML